MKRLEVRVSGLGFLVASREWKGTWPPNPKPTVLRSGVQAAAKGSL